MEKQNIWLFAIHFPTADGWKLTFAWCSIAYLRSAVGDACHKELSSAICRLPIPLECGQATVAQLTTKESKAEATLPITIEIIDLSH
jgi:hypothetical protein